MIRKGTGIVIRLLIENKFLYINIFLERYFYRSKLLLLEQILESRCCAHIIFKQIGGLHSK